MTPAKTYQMLWDCRYCGQAKLLGLTHRHCPCCGAPQDATKRYFPSDEEKVAVEDHALVGRDLTCPACKELSARAAKHCGHCGGPLDEGIAVGAKADVVLPEGKGYAGNTEKTAGVAVPPTARPAPTGARRRGIGTWIALAVGLALLVVLVLFFSKREVRLTVSGHEWTREITVERLSEVSEGAFCDAIPAGARVTARTERERGKRKVPDGENCNLRKVDNGDGTFTERREYTPKHREEPVMAPYCTYTARRWKKTRTERRSGTLNGPRTWPEVTLVRSGECLGCERVGPRQEILRVHLKDSDSKPLSCDVDEGRWSGLREGMQVEAEQRLTGGLACDSLAAR